MVYAKIGETIIGCIWIGNQKVVLFFKFRENQREAAASALKRREIISD